jgi:glycosyltransferase involved in cell wall biosynthesis
METLDGESITVGILIPTYKREGYLFESLRSALEQTYTQLEIIVINNCITDEVSNIVADFRDHRIKYIQNKNNIGLIGSIRKGMLLFSKKVAWCTILPDDDLLDHGFIESMAKFVTCQHGIEIVHGHWFLIDADGRKIGETSKAPECETAVEYLVNRSRSIRQTFLAGVFFSRFAYELIGGYPEFATGMASDDALSFGLSLKGGLYYNKNAIASVRMYPEAESHSSLNTFGHIQAFEDFRNYILKMSLDDNTLTRSNFKIICSVLDSYTIKSVSNLWLRRVRKLFIDDLPSRDKELSELYTLVRVNKSFFSLQVRADVFFAETMRWDFERSKLYRSLWLVFPFLQVFWFRVLNHRTFNVKMRE